MSVLGSKQKYSILSANVHSCIAGSMDRCNICNHTPSQKIRKRIGSELSQIWNAPNLTSATENLRFLFESHCQKTHYLVKRLENNVPEGLAVST